MRGRWILQAGRIDRVWSRELRDGEIKEGSELSTLVDWVDGIKLILVFVRPLSIFVCVHCIVQGFGYTFWS